MFQLPGHFSRALPLEMISTSVQRQKHRRFLKHHLTREHLPESALKRAAHIYVARDGRDVGLFLHNFIASFKPKVVEMANNLDFEGEPLPSSEEIPDPVKFFEKFFREDRGAWGSFWGHIRSWWAVRNEPNVLLVHYDALKRDPHAEVLGVLQFLRKFGTVRPGEEDHLT